MKLAIFVHILYTVPFYSPSRTYTEHGFADPNLFGSVSSVNWGNVVTFIAQNHFLSESYLGDLMLQYMLLYNLIKKILDVDMVIVAFANIFVPLKKKYVGMTRRVMSSPPHIPV